MPLGSFGSGTGAGWFAPLTASAAASDTDGEPGVPPGRISSERQRNGGKRPDQRARIADAASCAHRGLWPLGLDRAPAGPLARGR